MVIDRIQSYLNSKGQTIEDGILEEVSFLARQSFERQFGTKQESERSIRLSSIGRCTRQQAYNYLGIPRNGKEIDARAKTVFFQGDMVELAIVQLAKVAGCHILFGGRDQKTIQFKGVDGHPDGIFVNEAGTKYLLEVKSMSSYSFADFQEGKIDEGYVYQINAYLEALGLEECVMVAQNKDAGVLHEHIVKKNPGIVANIEANITTILSSSADNLPERPYFPDEKGFLPWNCLYCGWFKTCRPQAELVLVKNKYKLKESHASATA